MALSARTLRMIIIHKMTLCLKAFSRTTLSMTFSRATFSVTFSIATHSIIEFSRATLSVMTFSR